MQNNNGLPDSDDLGYPRTVPPPPNPNYQEPLNESPEEREARIQREADEIKAGFDRMWDDQGRVGEHPMMRFMSGCRPPHLRDNVE